MEQEPIYINGTAVERVRSFRFIGTASAKTSPGLITQRARRRLLFLRRRMMLNMHSRILCNFYRCTIESILTDCITAWYGNCTALDRKALHRVVKTVQHITRTASTPSGAGRRLQSPQAQTVLQHPVPHHQGQGRLQPTGHKPVELLSS